MEGKDLLSNTGAIASTIDLLAHEYGWSVEAILSLTMIQLRRTIRAINYRKKMKADAWKEAAKESGNEKPSKPGRTIDLGEDFEEAVRFGRKEKLSIKDL